MASYGPDHYRAVGDVYRRAVAEHTSVRDAVASAFGLNVRTAPYHILQARKLGHIAPAEHGRSSGSLRRHLINVDPYNLALVIDAAYRSTWPSDDPRARLMVEAITQFTKDVEKRIDWQAQYDKRTLERR